MKILIIFLAGLLLLADQAVAQDDVPDPTIRPGTKKDTAKSGSGFLNELAKNINDQKRKRDSLNKYFREHPMPTNTYISKFLVDRRILPNNDAIEFVKALNPRVKNLREINYYAELRMPVFKQLKKTDRKRLKKECKQLDKYESAAQRTLIIQVDDMESAVRAFNSTDIRSGSKSAMSNVLVEIREQLRLYSRSKLPKGITTFITGQTKTVSQLLRDITASRSISQVQQKVAQGIKDDISRPALKRLVFTFPGENPLKDDKWLVANSEGSGTNSQEVIIAEAGYDYYTTGTEEMLTKICAIYAKTVEGSGDNADQRDINDRYFYSYETEMDAVYKCRTGTCEKFSEKQGLISANGANIIPADYVFRFRDRETGKIYFRCITKDLFEQIQQTPGSAGKRKFRILFYPQADECKAYLPN